MKHSLGLALLLVSLSLVPTSVRAEESEGESAASSSVGILRERRWELHPQISIFNFNTLLLQKSGSEFSYANTFKGVPMIAVNLATPLGAWGDFDLYGMARVGYGTKTGEVPVDGTVGSQFVRLHAVPMEMLLKARYNMPQIPAIKPSFLVGLGTQFFHQSVRDDNFSASYFLPNLITGFSVGLFDAGKTSSDWFGGLNFGMMYHHGMGGENRLRAISFDLGVVVVL